MAVDELKKEITEIYLKDFKKELWFLKKIFLLPIEKPVKDIISWRSELPEHFDDIKEFWWRKDVIKFMSLDLSNQLFDFMKEKRLKIEQRKTEEELQKLKNEILWINTDNNQQDNKISDVEPSNQQNDLKLDDEIDTKWKHRIDPILWWALTSWAWTTAVISWAKIFDNIDRAKIAESLDAKKIRSTIESSISMMEDYKTLMPNSLTEKQLETVNKHINHLRKWLNEIDDDSLEALRLLTQEPIWKKMWWIEKDIFQKNWLSEKVLNKIEKLSDDIVGKSPEEISALLKLNGVDDVHESVIKSLSLAENTTEVKDMTKILRHWSKFNRFAQTMAGAMRVDVAFLWLDVWMYIETWREAELIKQINKVRWENKQQQANFQLMVWLSSVVIEAAWILALYAATWSAWWPIGAAIWIAVWALTTLVSIWWDSLYYDIRDFYLQDKEDFLRQKRWLLKQAILQCVHNKQEWDVSLNERMLSFRDPSMKSWLEKKEWTLQDVCFSMMFLEEIDVDWLYPNDYLMLQYIRSGEKLEDFVQKLSDSEKTTFNETYEKISKKIYKRMEYVNKQFEKQDIINATKWWSWTKKLTQIFNDSKIYEELSKNWNWNNNVWIDENKERYKDLLFKDLPKEKIKKFETLRDENQSLFVEILWSTTLDGFLREQKDKDITYKDEENNINMYYDKNWDKNYEENVKIVVLYKKWLSMTEWVENKYPFDVPNIYKNQLFIKNVLENDFVIDNADFERKSMTKDEIVRKTNIWMLREDNLDVSDDVFQNILYRLAKELFWYSGKNEKLEIIHYFNENDCNINWIYFSSKWMRNEDRRIDSELETTVLKQDIIHEKDVEKYTSVFMSQFFKIVEKWKWDRLQDNVMVKQKESIDSPTESIDPRLNEEFSDTLRSIVKQELLNHTIETQTKVKNDISNFVKKYWNWENYIDLPYYLIIDAKKAWLWDIQRQFFRYYNDKIEICYIPSELSQRGIIDDCEKSYITSARREYTEEEQYYIDRVDSVREKLGETLNSIWLPVELYDIISTKWKEWNTFKKNVLLYNGIKAGNSDIINKYVEYAEYFENLYRWILIAISWFRISNDISNVNYFNRAMSYWNQNIFDEEWNLLEVKEENYNIRNELAKQQEFRKFYNEQINKLKIWDKTIKELWKSEDKKEKDLAYCASNIIYVTVMEQALIDDQWQIHTWNDMYYNCNSYWWGWYSIKYIESRYKSSSWSSTKWAKIDQDKINKVSEIIENKIRKMKIAPDISEERVNELRTSQIIQKISNGEKECTDTIPQLQAKIEKIGEDINRKWKRWDIKYDTEKSVIRSRWKEVKVELLTENNIKLKWLDLELTLQDWIWLANFKNWIKNKYPDKKITFERSYINRSLSFGKTFHVDDTMLITRWDLENLCPICNNDEIVEKITEWLNQNM